MLQASSIGKSWFFSTEITGRTSLTVAQNVMPENKESLQNLKENLAEYGIDLAKFPVVMQYNKRDLPNVYSIEELQRELNIYGFPYTEAIAFKGVGLMETLKLISKITLQRIGQKTGTGASTAEQAAPQPAPAAAPQSSSEFFRNLQNKMK